jgi:hypothetical protein
MPSLSLAVPLARELRVSTDWLLGMDTSRLEDNQIKRAKLSELAFLHQLTAALNEGKLTQTQIWLLSEMMRELIRSSQLAAVSE